jgi:mono/diheme cytochrome c family protein
MNYPKRALERSSCLAFSRFDSSRAIEAAKPLRWVIGATLACVAGANVFAAEAGAVVFENHCIPCHGPDGRARTPAGRKLGAKDLSESKLGDSEIAKQIRDGVKDPRGADRMPSFREKITAAEVDTLVAYVKTFRRRK